MKDLGISPGFIDGLPEDEQDLTICSLEFRVKPAQLAGMTPALNSIEFPHKKEHDILSGPVICQADLGSISRHQLEFGSQGSDL
jgi:hypothetical protein